MDKRIIIIFILSLAAIFVVTSIRNSQDSSISKEICYKGHSYVKFNDNYYSWGSIVLDDNGKPVKCGTEVRK